MNKINLFVNKTKTLQNLNNIRLFVFLHSLWFAAFIFMVGLILDLINGNTIFQRCGAIIVGFAVLHVFENNYLSSKIRYLGLLRANGILASIDSIPKLKDGLLPQLNSENEVSFTMLRNMLTPVESSAGVAQEVALEVIKMRDNEGMYISKQKQISRNEWMLAILGTFIWALGDWLTNYFYHCPGNLSCS